MVQWRGRARPPELSASLKSRRAAHDLFGIRMSQEIQTEKPKLETHDHTKVHGPFADSVLTAVRMGLGW
jgi:hypothetical protein